MVKVTKSDFQALKISRSRGLERLQKLQNLTVKLKRYKGCEGCKG